MTNVNDTLPELMHRATENLEPVSTDLLERTVQQGLRLRRRRMTLLTATGAGAVLATAGLVVGATQLVGSPSDTAVAGTTPTPSAKPNTPTAQAVTAKDALATLKTLVRAPGLTLSKPQTWGDKSAFGAAYVVDDGNGASRVEVLLTGGGEENRCAAANAGCTTLPDGSTLFSLTDQPEYSGNRNVHGVLSNHVERYLPDGRFISVTSYNAPAEKGSQHTRTKPLYTVAQLTTLAQSKSWPLPPKSTVLKPTKGATDKTKPSTPR
ncbi:hypothetical protein AB0F43_06125 [Kribbella sp. NPDC023972]|uniref:hypothetical protein n=1 Tax=Kribbella sp. NPDC023972 TaxID=3154795 RepID=UPI0033C50173